MNEYLESAQNNLCIQTVNLKESTIFVRDGIELPSLNREGTNSQSFRAVAKIKEITLADAKDKESWDYRFIYSIGIRLIFPEEEEESIKEDYKPIVEIVGFFEAKYFSQKQLSEDELDAFAIDNVGYHVWPYWREYVQSSCARIGFSPAFEVPLYIINRKEEESE
ncbi:MAG: hypothetical protein KZQ76_13835 [Candidatus Thiodiazotropha sp. (ex Epidulcina cf. delphinae)]|nr:hypothetical protein [Candidatus Thiodiazotropha sp. (ex Epidulcina cf. delphinae)]